MTKINLEKLKEWINIIQKAVVFVAVFEAILVLIIGVASSNVYHQDYADWWMTILVVLGIIYLFLTLIKVGYNYKFPVSIVDNLQSKLELIEMEKSVRRKDAINEYISDTIVNLSQCVSKLRIENISSDYKKDSDEDFANLLSILMATFSNVQNILFNTNNIKFSSGVYIKEYLCVNMHNSTEKNGGVYFFRDDFKININGELKDVFDRNNISSFELDFQTILKYSFFNSCYYSKIIDSNNCGDLQVICLNIPDFRDDKRGDDCGVLFVFTEPICELPNDLESVLSVFVHLLGQMLLTYEHQLMKILIQAMVNSLKEKNKIKIEPTVKHLESNISDEEGGIEYEEVE